MFAAGIVTFICVELTNVIGNVGPNCVKLNPTISTGVMPPLTFCVNPVPFIVSVRSGLPATTDAGLRLVIVSVAAAVLKFALTSDSSVGVNIIGFAVDVTSPVQPVNIHWPAGLVVAGVSVKVN